MTDENRKIVLFVESIAESTTACLVTMVQGNVLALTLSHVAIASQTGVIAGTLTGVAIVSAKARNRWVISVLLGVATAVVDYVVHPGMFGPAALEAIVTGISAALLSYLVGSVVRIWRRRASGAN